MACPPDMDDVYYAIGSVLFARLFELSPELEEQFSDSERQARYASGVIRAANALVNRLSGKPHSKMPPGLAKFLVEHAELVEEAFLWLLELLLTNNEVWDDYTQQTWEQAWVLLIDQADKIVWQSDELLEQEVNSVLQYEAEFLESIRQSLEDNAPVKTREQISRSTLEDVEQGLQDLGVPIKDIAFANATTKYDWYFDRAWGCYLDEFCRHVKQEATGFCGFIRELSHHDQIATLLAERQDGWDGVQDPMEFLEDEVYGQPFLEAQVDEYNRVY